LVPTLNRFKTPANSTSRHTKHEETAERFVEKMGASTRQMTLPCRMRANTPIGGRADYGGKPVAAAKLGSDRVPVRAENPAQHGDLNFQIFLHNSYSWPDAGDELIFGDQRSIGLEQGKEEIEGACSELNRCAVTEQPPLSQQHAETAEFESRTG